jgi:RNA polymerase sigma-70 factor (ECF subfamily)
VVEVNRAVAHGYAFGPDTGLALLATVRDALPDYAPALAVEADLTARAGDPVRAASLFREAAARTAGASERRALLERAENPERSTVDGSQHRS